MELAGPFVLGEVLGAGAQGEVLRAVHAPTGTAVAVKRSVGPADHFHHELQALADLDHPNVVRLWGAGVTEGRSWFAMELARTTLAATPPSDWGTLRGVLERLLGALGHVHARGLLHLDVKPANVLLGCEDGPDELEPEALAGLRLSDFGLSGGRAGTKLAGTPGYAPPEQLAGHWRELGPATDLFALGEVAWRLATRRQRFEGSPTEVLRAKLHHTPVPFVPNLPVPPGFAEWLRWLLDPRSTARPQRAVEALDELPDDLLPQSVPAPPVSEGATWIDEDALPGPTDLPPGPLAARRIPRDRPWQVREVWGRVRWLEGGGLGPLHSRMPRLAGRTAERERLWALLQGVRTTGRPAAVQLTGAPGMGASRLAAWLGGRAHEADQAVAFRYGPGDDLASVLRREAGADGLTGQALHERMRVASASWGFSREVGLSMGEVVADGADPLPLIRLIPPSRPLLVLHDDPTWSGAWSPVLAALLAEPLAAVFVVLVTPRVDTPGEVLTLGPLGVADVDPLLDRWMGLSRPLADAVLVASGGVPGAIVSLLAALDAAGRLRSTPDGFVADGPLPGRVVDSPVDPAPGPPTASGRALLAARAGRLEEARAAIDELVWNPQPPDLAAITLALEHQDPDHPATVLLPLRLTARRGLLRDALASSVRIGEEARTRGWSRVEAAALELRSWALTLIDRDGAALAAAEAAQGFTRCGDLVGAARCRRRQATFELDPERREALLLPDLQDPALRAHTLVQLCSTDPLRWDDALRRSLPTDPWLGPEGERALTEAASLRGHHAEAMDRVAASWRSERARLDRIWVGILRLTEANVHRRRGSTDEALAVCLDVMGGSISGAVTEARLVAAGVCLLRAEPHRVRRLLAFPLPSHPTLRLLGQLMALGADLAEDRGEGARERWGALWVPHPELARSVWVQEWWPLIEEPSERLGLGLSWPVDLR